MARPLNNQLHTDPLVEVQSWDLKRNIRRRPYGQERVVVHGARTEEHVMRRCQSAGICWRRGTACWVWRDEVLELTAGRKGKFCGWGVASDQGGVEHGMRGP